MDTQAGTERDLLEAFLRADRAEIRGLVDGVTEAHARRRLVLSLTTLLPRKLKGRRRAEKRLGASTMSGSGPMMGV